MEKDEERKCPDARSTAPVARRGQLIDHSVFRRLAQEARTSGQRDGGPVAGPGQLAAYRARDGWPD
ncbi:hypothetical protein DF018_05795 [Burkholderia cenocepacia]|nr:hypothetical protein DF132_14935 [Burkholderia cenocepacia]RQV74424.1 hypothetical protein DF018_05795 [Burkholderia cenocepacia]